MAKRLTLATVTAVLLLTTAAMAQTEVRFTHSITGGTSREALDSIIADFETANPDIKIKEIVFDDDQYSNQGLITQLKSNEVPDIFFDWAGLRVQRDVEAGYAYDLQRRDGHRWLERKLCAVSLDRRCRHDGRWQAIPGSDCRSI